MPELFQWVDYQDGDVEGKEIYFAITINAGQVPIASSNGIDPILSLLDENAPFVQAMFDRFDITIDQLEGEINLPYEYERTPEHTRIRVPKSLLGGFTQFRINYQYIYYPSDVYETMASEDDEGFVTNGFVTTPRTIVPRRTLPPPEPLQPAFQIDENQIKETLADKIYEKFFSDPTIDTSDFSIESLQTTTSETGVGYSTGRTSEDDQLIFFKKDRNTPENTKDFYNDQTDENPLNQVVLHISQSVVDTANINGTFDLQQTLDDNLNISVYTPDTRIPSDDFYDPPRYNVSVDDVDIPVPYYVEVTTYRFEFTRQQTSPIFIPFGEIHKFFVNSEGDVKYQPDEWINKVNLSQLTKAKTSKKISPERAREILDTVISELLPNNLQRQNQINQFFTTTIDDLIDDVPAFIDSDGDGVIDTISDPDSYNGINYSPDDLSAFIIRTIEEETAENSGQSLEALRNLLNQYLVDVDAFIEEIPDVLPEYENKSEGFLKLRRLNQAILIRGIDDVTPLTKIETREVTTTETTYDPNWTPASGTSPEIITTTTNTYTGPVWAIYGFTVTMWVRFINGSTGGNLLTLGNPFTKKDSSFRLETLTRSDENVTTGELENRRIVRLIVFDQSFELEQSGGKLYDSSVAVSNRDKHNTLISGKVQYGTQEQVDAGIAFSNSLPSFRDSHINAQIPTDNLNEWFFICASYDPNVNEVGSYDMAANNRNPEFWLGQRIGDSYQNKTGLGNRCKVEIISKSDLLRARGFKV